jgi:hypothetical protein
MTLSTPRKSGRIFISYRRDETDFPAGWLYERLAAHFGPDQVFKDVDSIELGDDFAEVIANAVGACDVLLVLIGAQWLAMTDEAGRRRLENSYDFVRLELEAALQRKVRIIPILVGRAKMPHAEQLPPTLGKLVNRQALELDPNRFEADTRRLVRVVEKTLAEEEARRDAEARREAEESRLTTVLTKAASLRADGQAEVDAAEAALRRLAADESERVAQVAQAVLHAWEVEHGDRESGVGRRAGHVDEERQRRERAVGRVPPIEAADAAPATAPVEIPAPEPPRKTSAGVRLTRRRLVVAEVALAGLLVAGGVAYAQYRRDVAPPVAVPRPAVTTGPTIPADEQCTPEIKSNPRWVCLTSAVIADGKLTVKYNVNYHGSKPNIYTGFHLHIYGSDGTHPPDHLMGSQAPKSTRGNYVWVAENPYIVSTKAKDYAKVIGEAKKVCARIAIAGHGLVRDKKSGYKTGNCVPITRDY